MNESAFHSQCICEQPGAVGLNHECVTCGKLHPDSIRFAILGSGMGWVFPFVAMVNMRRST